MSMAESNKFIVSTHLFGGRLLTFENRHARRSDLNANGNQNTIKQEILPHTPKPK